MVTAMSRWTVVDPGARKWWENEKGMADSTMIGSLS